MMTEIPLLRLEWLDLPIEEPTVADVLRILNKSAKTADAKGESKVGDWRRGQAGRIGVYRADYLELLGIDGDYKLKAGELIGHLRGNKERYDKSVYSPTLEGDIDVLVNVLLLYHVIKESMSEDTPATQAEAWEWKKVFDKAFNRVRTLDSLTGLKNREGLFENLEDQIDIFHKSKTKFSLMLIDVDGFKKVNDLRGHDRGNEVLINLAEDFKKEFERTGEPFRLYGDEFVVLIPEEGIGQAKKKAKKLKKRINKEYANDGLTLSIGVAEMSEAILKVANDDRYDLIDPKSLVLAMVDSATYLAKDQGKNQVVNWEQVAKPKDLVEAASKKEKQMHEALKELIKRKGQD